MHRYLTALSPRLTRQDVLARLHELTKFVTTGALCAGLNLLIIFVLTRYLGLYYGLSITICFLCISVVGFWINRRWTFRKRGGGARTDFGRFLFVVTVQFLFIFGVSSICVNVLHISYLLALAALSAAMAPVTFLLHRCWSFGLRTFRGVS